MNVTTRQHQFSETFITNFITFTLGVIINYINGTFVYTFFKSELFYRDPRYILYIHLVINDIIMLSLSIILQVVVYSGTLINVSVCFLVLLLTSTTNKNNPLNLAAMAIERYIAVCKPLHHSQICTVRRTYILICLIWGVAGIHGLIDIIITLATQPLSFLSSGVMCYIVGLYNSVYHKTKSTAMNVMYLLFVWLTLVVTYFKVLFAAKAAATDRVSAKKARNTILLHGIQLLLCMLSYISPMVNLVLIPYFPKYGRTILFVNYVVTNICPRLLSPLVYGVRDKNLVKYMKHYFSCKSCPIQVKPTSFRMNK